MMTVLVVAHSKLLAGSFAAAVDRFAKVIGQACSTDLALKLIREQAPAVVVLLPLFDRRVELALIQSIAGGATPPRIVLILDETSERAVDCCPSVPAHARVRFSAGVDALKEAVLYGRSGTDRLRRDPKAPSSRLGRVTLPNGTVITATQAEVLRRHCSGAPHVEIARSMGISPRTVETHMRAIREATGIVSNVELLLAFSPGAGATHMRHKSE